MLALRHPNGSYVFVAASKPNSCVWGEMIDLFVDVAFATEEAGQRILHSCLVVKGAVDG